MTKLSKTQREFLRRIQKTHVLLPKVVWFKAKPRKK